MFLVVATIPSLKNTALIFLSFLLIKRLYIPRNALSPTAYIALPLRVPMPCTVSDNVPFDTIDGGSEDWNVTEDRFA